MGVAKRRLLSKPKLKHNREKTMKLVHKVLKERRLIRNQICDKAETEEPGKSSLKCKTESVQNEPLNSVNRVQKKRRLIKIFDNPVLAQEKQETKSGGTMKPDCCRCMETQNQRGKKITTKISLKSNKTAEKEGISCDRRKMKIDKEREAARLALEQVRNTCGFSDNMDSMRDFEKLVGCSSTFYIFSRGR